VVGLADAAVLLANSPGWALDALRSLTVGERAEPRFELALALQPEICTRGFHTGILRHDFQPHGDVPLPLALHLASYTVLGLSASRGRLNLIDPGKIPHGLMFLACAASAGHVFAS